MVLTKWLNDVNKYIDPDVKGISGNYIDTENKTWSKSIRKCDIKFMDCVTY